MTIIGGLLIYLGLFAAATGIVSLVKPIRLLGIATRAKALLALSLGLLVFAAGVYLPVGETRVASLQTRLDEFVPIYQFSEFHSIGIHASASQVYAAIRTVCPDEIRFYRTLTWIRRFGRPSPGGVLSPPDGKPILATFLSPGASQLLADDPGIEIVFGRIGTGRGLAGQSLTPQDFKSLQSARMIRIAMDFRIREVDATHSWLTFETRVYAVGRDEFRGFAAYWRMIYPGSSLIRRMWLRAIKLRAEAASAPVGG